MLRNSSIPSLSVFILSICLFVCLSCRFIMAELLQTERTYVKDLEICIRCYLDEMNDPTNETPPAIHGKQDIIFGNIRDIYEFHKK